jgi:SNF2 family DNA or RNA helicase
MRVWTENEKAIVKCDFAEKEIVKAIGDYKFDKVTKTWQFPLNRLPKIIDSLKIEFTPETKVVYDRLCQEKLEWHSRVNLANDIKSGMFYHKQKEEDWIFKVGLNKLNLDDLMVHQLQMLELGVLFGSYAFFAEPGCGKTLTAIRLIEYFPKPAIVVAPLSTLENVWMREFEKWSKVTTPGKKSQFPNRLTICNLYHNLSELKEDRDVYLINYEHFKILAKDFPDKKFETIVIDESSRMRSNTSETTKTLLSYRKKINHRFILTGTPAPNNLMEYHGQMTMINDQIFPENFYQFRNTYFTPIGYGGFKYVPKSGAKDAIMNKIGLQAFSIRKEDCFDLPEKVFEERAIYLEKVQEKAYDEMLRENILEFDEHVTLAQNELVKLMKLRQITSGWTITTEGIPVLISKSKIKALLELLDEIPAEQQVIIFCQFHFEINELKKELGECSTYYGQMDDKEKEKSLNLWLEKKTRVLLAHPKTGGIGLNLQQANYMIWFSLSYSQEEFTQACDRIYRKGQKNKCTYFVLLAQREEEKSVKDKTIDKIIYEVVQDKQDLMQACMAMLK